LADGGLRIVQTPFQAPNSNAYAERFAGSIKEECLNQVVVLGEVHLRRTLTHSRRTPTRNGITRRLIAPDSLAPPGAAGPVR
jgi:hypothetical protein